MPSEEVWHCLLSEINGSFFTKSQFTKKNQFVIFHFTTILLFKSEIQIMCKMDFGRIESVITIRRHVKFRLKFYFKYTGYTVMRDKAKKRDF